MKREPPSVDIDVDDLAGGTVKPEPAETRQPAMMPKGTVRQPPIVERPAHSLSLPKVESASQEISSQTRNETEYTDDVSKKTGRLPTYERWCKQANDRLKEWGWSPWTLVKKLGRTNSAQPVYDLLNGKVGTSSLIKEVSDILKIEYVYGPHYERALEICEEIYVAAGGGAAGERAMQRVEKLLANVLRKETEKRAKRARPVKA